MSLTLLFPVLSSATPLAAQVAGKGSSTSQTPRIYRRPTLDDRIRVLAKNLELSEFQQAAVKKILEQRQQEALRIRLEPSMNGEARIERFRALQDDTVRRIRAVLNEAQKKKYDPLAVRRIQPAPDQRSVEDWLKITTPKN